MGAGNLLKKLFSLLFNVLNNLLHFKVNPEYQIEAFQTFSVLSPWHIALHTNPALAFVPYF